MKLPHITQSGVSVVITDGSMLIDYINSFFDKYGEMPIFDTIDGSVVITNQCYLDVMRISNNAIREFYGIK